MGGSGNDTLETDGIGDTLLGFSGNDLLIARTTINSEITGSVLDGGVGDDTIIGDLNSTITGGDGADVITIASAFAFATMASAYALPHAFHSRNVAASAGIRARW